MYVCVSLAICPKFHTRFWRALVMKFGYSKNKPLLGHKVCHQLAVLVHGPQSKPRSHLSMPRAAVSMPWWLYPSTTPSCVTMWCGLVAPAHTNTHIQTMQQVGR